MRFETTSTFRADQASAVSPLARQSSPVWPILFAAWLVALGSTAGALFIGEVMGKTPCLLCWYQRAFMFPLAVILGVACYTGDGGAWRYGLPLAAIGVAIAGYHNLLYWGVIPEDIQPCTRTGPSCSSADLNLIGVIPIPLLSLGAFAALMVLLLIVRRRLAS
jgi:disulfide bond formation protein DsbB